jgi:hypothetical protein
MQRARACDSADRSAPGRGADQSAPRPTPLTLVAGAVAGDDLQHVAATVAEALRRPVAIAIPALGDPVVSGAQPLSADIMSMIAQHAAAVVGGRNGTVPEGIAQAVPVQIGEQIVGVVAVPGAAPQAEDAAQRAWLDAAAAAASVAALISETHAGTPAVSGAPAADLLAELAGGPPQDVPAMIARARRLGHELTAGAVALCARAPDGPLAHPPTIAALTALRPGGRLLAVAGLGDGAVPWERLVQELREAGLVVHVSAPRRDPALVHGAIVEAELLTELAADELLPAGQDETFRLLIGVLQRDRDELERLRDGTVTPLADYDARHDTDLLATLHAFLTHDGSTTETAEAMSLHRHTVGYRLSRVHEVSGLSPYESDGRERLSLGIKAHQILEADRRRGTPS